MPKTDSVKRAEACASRRVRLVRDFAFEAAHQLPHAPENHKCRRLHGHSFKVEVACEGEADPESGWLLDFAEIRKAVGPVIELLDHRFLNELEGLENPTAENLARWLWIRIAPQLPYLTELTIAETCTSRCVYKG